MRRARSNFRRETLAPLLLLGGDVVGIFGGLSLGYYLRYHSWVGTLGLEVPNATFRLYLPLLLVGEALLIITYAHLGLYDSRLLLRRYQSLNIILKGSAFWFAAYLSVSLVLEFTPPISRLFVVLAFACVVAVLGVWRGVCSALFRGPRWHDHLRQRAALIGWSAESRALADALQNDPGHPFALAGVITLPGEPPPARTPWLGTSDDLARVLSGQVIDLAILTRLDIPRDDLRRLTEACERSYVDWKIVPSSFDIFLSGLRLQTIGRTPLLGVEALAITRPLYALIKRLTDITGALVGLLLGTPIALVCALLIKRESPGGPVLFRQQRVGADHRDFTLYKLRSMEPDAAARDHEQQSTARGDPRLLKIGAFLRRWNLDEIPQFWNVLRGEMSLVGPRPERPTHVARLAEVIPHYLPRHVVKPGMSGWAQVNGLRGDSDLIARIQYDIYYIENWSIWLDAQIILLTLVRWRTPSAY